MNRTIKVHIRGGDVVSNVAFGIEGEPSLVDGLTATLANPDGVVSLNAPGSTFLIPSRQVAWAEVSVEVPDDAAQRPT